MSKRVVWVVEAMGKRGLVGLGCGCLTRKSAEEDLKEWKMHWKHGAMELRLTKYVPEVEK